MNKMHPCPYFSNMQMHPCPCGFSHGGSFYDDMQDSDYIKLKDYGPQPFVVNIEEATLQNDTFRTALWTGEHLQVTLMSIDVGDDIVRRKKVIG